MPKTIAITNQKGGVGKTTTAINLGASLAVADMRVLIVDADAQGNSTSGLGLRGSFQKSFYHSLVMDEPLGGIVLDTELPNLKVVPSEKILAAAEIELVDLEGREFRLKKLIASVADSYDYILIDCPPSLGLLTLNALAAADSVLIPIQCEYFALEGVSELWDTLVRIRRALNPGLAIEGFLLTMFDERTNLSNQVVSDLREFLGSQVFSTIIPRNVRLAEAPSHGKPIILYDIKSKGAEGYLRLAKEIISNVKKGAGQGA
ncbi:MAG TPA: ParA family protein [Blastocatellia bacterium]|jgi:chromosome partitioning protein|nr:ParA family protein [Blastocatellia bacterium]